MKFQVLSNEPSQYTPDETNNHKTLLVAVIDEIQALTLLPPCGAGSIAMLEDQTTRYKKKIDGTWLFPNATDVLITAQPEDVATTAGAITESLSVAAYCNTGGTITYQWYKNDTKNTTTPDTLAGATSASYTIDDTLVAGTYYYYCILTCGGVAVTSSIATVVVEAAA